MSWMKQFLEEHTEMDYDDIEAELNRELSRQREACYQDRQEGRKHLAKERDEIMDEIIDFMFENNMMIREE